MYPTIKLFDTNIYVFPFILLAALSVCFVVYIHNRSKYQVGFASQFIKCLIPVLVGAAIFGRLLSALVLTQTSHGSFLEALLNGGFVFYGGVIGGLIGGLIYSLVKHQSFFDLSDVVLSLLPLGQAIGRMGCYLNGCCYGREHLGFPSVFYVVDGIETRVFPTWFFESLFCLLLALYFQLLCRTSKRGFQTAVYLIAYSSFRFVIEFYRGDEIRGVYGWLSTSQIISIVFFVLGIITLVYSRVKNEENNFLKQRSFKYEF